MLGELLRVGSMFAIFAVWFTMRWVINNRGRRRR